MTTASTEYPLPDRRLPSRKEERTISQRDIENAQDNMRFLGLHLVGGPVAGVVGSISSSSSSTMPKSGSSFKACLTSEVGTKSNWERNEALRWFNRRTQSDSGIDVQRDDVSRKTQHNMTMNSDHKKEQDTDLLTPPPRRWKSDRSPTTTRSPETSWAGAQMIPEDEEVDAIPDGGTRSGTAKGSVVCLRAATGPGVDTPPTLFERRSTISQAIIDPAGPAKPYVVAGHSGAGHPPGADEIGPGVSFGEDPLQPTTEPRGPRLSVAGPGTFLPISSGPIEKGTGAEDKPDLQNLSSMPRQHDKQGAVVKHMVHSDSQ